MVKSPLASPVSLSKARRSVGQLVGRRVIPSKRRTRRLKGSEEAAGKMLYPRVAQHTPI